MSTENENVIQGESSELANSPLNQESFLEKIGGFFGKNSKVIGIAVAGVAVVILGYFGYQKWVVQPYNVESAEKIYEGESAFVDGQDWDAVIEGDSSMQKTLADQAKKYEGYAGGNIASFDIGVAHLNLGNYEEAKKVLESISFDDEIIETKRIGAIGDALAGLEKYSDAYAKYQEAYERRAKNTYTAPLYLMKMANIKELEGKFDVAAKHYTDVIEKFPNSSFVSDAKKYRVLNQNNLSAYEL